MGVLDLQREVPLLGLHGALMLGILLQDLADALHVQADEAREVHNLLTPLP